MSFVHIRLDALLQKFEIKQGDIRFSKKYLESDAYKKGIAAKHPVINEFGTPAQRDPNKGFFSRIVSNLVNTQRTMNLQPLIINHCWMWINCFSYRNSPTTTMQLSFKSALTLLPRVTPASSGKLIPSHWTLKTNATGTSYSVSTGNPLIP